MYHRHSETNNTILGNKSRSGQNASNNQQGADMADASNSKSKAVAKKYHFQKIYSSTPSGSSFHRLHPFSEPRISNKVTMGVLAISTRRFVTAVLSQKPPYQRAHAAAIYVRLIDERRRRRMHLSARPRVRSCVSQPSRSKLPALRHQNIQFTPPPEFATRKLKYQKEIFLYTSHKVTFSKVKLKRNNTNQTNSLKTNSPYLKIFKISTTILIT